MNFRQRLALMLLGSKESQSRIITTSQMLGRAVSTPANYEAFASHGYSKNLVVYSAISKITTAAKGVNWLLYNKGKSRRSKLTEIETHNLLTLLDKPNPLQARAAFFESLVGYKLIAGNSYVEANMGLKAYGEPLELWPARPDKMKVVVGKNGYPAAYEFSHGGVSKRFDVDPLKLTSKILHWKTFNPLNDWYGLSALEAAMLTLDQNNAGQKWNLALLQNSATPSGVLQMKATDANPRGSLTEEQYKRVKAEFEENYSGARNAGKPLVIEGGLNWQATSLSPKEMDFLKSREYTAIDLCVALGVPPEIMGLGQKTFNNYAEARLAFYEETVLPTLDDLRDALNSWLVPAFGEGLFLDYDRDDIEALGVRRSAKLSALKDIGFLTINEKREECGYDEREDGDVLDKPSSPFGGPNEEEDSTDTEDQTADDVEDLPASEDETEEADEEESDDGKGFLKWKAINLVNRVEKVQSWKRQNARRKQLSYAFEKDLRNEWGDLTEKLKSTASNLKGSTPRVVEFALKREAEEWAEKELSKTLAKHIRATLEDFGGMVLGEAKSLQLISETKAEEKANLKFDSFVKTYVKNHSAKQIKTINSANEKTIRRVVSGFVQDAIVDGDSSVELADMIGAKFKELSASSSARIARTEVGMASNNGTLQAVKSLGDNEIYKEWVSASDARVRDGDKDGPDHEFANGQEQQLDEKFSVPPDCLMDGPGDTSAPADQVINCRCVLTFKSKRKNN